MLPATFSQSPTSLILFRCVLNAAWNCCFLIFTHLLFNTSVLKASSGRERAHVALHVTLRNLKLNQHMRVLFMNGGSSGSDGKLHGCCFPFFFFWIISAIAVGSWGERVRISCIMQKAFLWQKSICSFWTCFCFMYMCKETMIVHSCPLFLHNETSRHFVICSLFLTVCSPCSWLHIFYYITLVVLACMFHAFSGIQIDVRYSEFLWKLKECSSSRSPVRSISSSSGSIQSESGTVKAKEENGPLKASE